MWNRHGIRGHMGANYEKVHSVKKKLKKCSRNLKTLFTQLLENVLTIQKIVCGISEIVQTFQKDARRFVLT